jgi:uncharacterized cupredoxin-like copper-binding protein
MPVSKQLRRLPLLLVILLATAALVAAGCGGDDDNGGGGGGGGSSGGGGGKKQTSSSGGVSAGGGQTLKLSADPSGQLKFDKSSLTAKAGKVTLVMDNPSSLPHAIAVEGNGVDKDGATVNKGGVSKVSATLKPGKYEFYCPVDAHKQGGMEGELTVQ